MDGTGYDRGVQPEREIRTTRALRRVRALAERPLTADEVREGLRARMVDSEIGEARALLRWFRTRYPDPAARLAYARRAYARWAATMPRAR